MLSKNWVENAFLESEPVAHAARAPQVLDHQNVLEY